MRSDNRKIGRIVQARKRKSEDSVAEGERKKIILFGGTFDPPHVGHLTMAQIAYEQYGADEVWFLAAPSPPHKQEEVIHTLSHRTRMVEALLAPYPHLRVMPIEESLPVPSYSVDTVRACLQWYPDFNFVFLIGADSLANLPDWHKARDLVRTIEFVVASRSGYPYQETLETVIRVLPELCAAQIEMPVLDVSSTWIRDRLEDGKPVCGLIPKNVLDIWMNPKAEDTN